MPRPSDSPRLSVLAHLPTAHLDAVVQRLARSEHGGGRPWARSRELAAVFAMSKSQAHRILVDLLPRLAALLPETIDRDRRWSWIVDGTLVPTRDHACAAKSKNYRWSCNLQVLARRTDVRIVAIDGGGPGNRNDPIHYRASSIGVLCRDHHRVLADGGYRGIAELITPVFHNNRIVRDRRWRAHRRRRARVEHAIGRLKSWRVLRDHRRRGQHLLATARAVAFLHNLSLDGLRDSP